MVSTHTRDKHVGRGPGEGVGRLRACESSKYPYVVFRFVKKTSVFTSLTACVSAVLGRLVFCFSWISICMCLYRSLLWEKPGEGLNME